MHFKWYAFGYIFLTLYDYKLTKQANITVRFMTKKHQFL